MNRNARKGKRADTAMQAPNLGDKSREITSKIKN